MKRRSKEEWRSLVTEQASSGKSLESFVLSEAYLRLVFRTGSTS